MPGNDPTAPSTDTESTPADAFALVGHEIRVEIIKILGEKPEVDELSLSELRARLSTDVEPSQLHYHLQKLVGHFIEKTEDGYTLRPAGAHLCLVLYAETFDRRQERLSVDANVDCYYCKAPVEASFDDGCVVIECSDCVSNYGIGFLGVPLEAFENAAAAFSHARKYIAIQTVFLSYGVCPSCGHPLTPEFNSLKKGPNQRKVAINQLCDLCSAKWSVQVGRALLTDPGLISFCADHGVDILSTPFWEHEFAATDEYMTIRSTDPWEVALEVTFDGDTLELVVDGDLNIVERDIQCATDVQDALLPDKDACLEHLRQQRWPDGVTCPHCNSANTIKKGTTGKETKRYRCHNCDSIFNDLTGTIFAGHQLSLPEMIHIIRETEETKTAQIVRQLDRSYPSILDFIDEVQAARDGDPDSNLPGLGEIGDTLPPTNENGNT